MLPRLSRRFPLLAAGLVLLLGAVGALDLARAPAEVVHRFPADPGIHFTEFTDDDRLILGTTRLRSAGPTARAVEVWETRTWRRERTLPGGTGFSLARRALLVTSPFGPPSIWDTRTWRRRQLTELPNWAFGGRAALSPDGRLIAGSLGRGAAIWSAATRRLVSRTEGSSSSGDTPAFSPDGKLLVYYPGGWGPSGMEVAAVRTGGRVVHLPITRLWFTNAGRTALTIGSQGAVEERDTETWRVTRQVTRVPWYARAAALSGDGALLAHVDEQGVIRLHDVLTGTLVGRWQGVPHARTACLNRDGSLLCVAGSDGGRVWHIRSRSTLLLRARLARTLRLPP